MAVQVPEWVKHAVFYQIFPDRFARSERNGLPRGLIFKPWGAPPEEQGFQGGDLYGIVEKLDYLQELGITALYLNPVFSSASNHRYHTFDYFTVDPLLGGNDALRVLIDELHRRDMKIVLDAVFNHASRGFWPFHHVLENGGNSPYVDWFYIHDWPLTPYPVDAETPINYAAWWDLPALPKLNVANPGVRDYLLEVSKFWIDFGIDGWRLDVPEEITDVAFWQELRCVVKGANPEAYIVGEIWHEAPDWLEGDRFDAVMNYVLSRAAITFFGGRTLRTEYKPGGFTLAPLRAAEFALAIEKMVSLYDWEIVQAQFNLMDSHDTARTLWTVGGDVSALKLCTLLQLTMPGSPCLYYGNEIGMTGANDPYNRGAFPWHDHSQWDEELLDFFKQAVALRREHAVLRTGKVKTLYADNGVYACLRALETRDQHPPAGITNEEIKDEIHPRPGDSYAIVVYNTRHAPVQVNLPELNHPLEGAIFEGVWNGRSHRVQQGVLTGVGVPARDITVLTCNRLPSQNS